MIQTLIILYDLNSIAPIPRELFCITWVLVILKVLSAAIQAANNAKEK